MLVHALCERELADRAVRFPMAVVFRDVNNSRASTVLCTGTLKGVQLVHSDGRAVAKVCHPRRVEAVRHSYIKPEYLYL